MEGGICLLRQALRILQQALSAVYPGKRGRRQSADSFDNTGPLVLTHQYIAMRNIMVWDDGRLWLIDWGWAEFYPPWFKFVAMRLQSQPSLTNKSDPLWDLLIPFVCGPYYRQEACLTNMALALYRI